MQGEATENRVAVQAVGGTRPKPTVGEVQPSPSRGRSLCFSSEEHDVSPLAHKRGPAPSGAHHAPPAPEPHGPQQWDKGPSVLQQGIAGRVESVLTLPLPVQHPCAHVELRGEGWCYAVWVFPCLRAYQGGSLGCKGWKRYNNSRVFNSRSFWTLFLAEKESRGELKRIKKCELGWVIFTMNCLQLSESDLHSSLQLNFLSELITHWTNILH